MGLRNISLISLLLISNLLYAQHPNDRCATAFMLASNYCSADAAFSTITAIDNGIPAPAYWQPHTPTGGKDVWFKFTALAYDVTIVVNGNVAGAGTLEYPLVALYETDCNTYTPLPGNFSTVGNLANFSKGQLTIGKEYYIRVSAANNQSGTFKLCVNNFNSVNPGQDYLDAALLCSKAMVTETAIAGGGLDPWEPWGTCLGGMESNTAWYKWVAANNGTLTFTITPTVTTDDIDFVLYDLGTVDDPFAIYDVTNVIRCAAGHGVNNTTCPTEPIYYKTGLDFGEIDISEPGGCGFGQNGKVKYIDMQQGHYYALLVSNFSSANHGFTIEFGGTGEFEQSKADFDMVKNNPCQPNQSYTFTNRSVKSSTLKWSFGKDANIPSSDLPGPHTVTYSSSGTKTVVLEAITEQGCFTVASKTFDYDASVTPVQKITLKHPVDFCAKTTIDLETENKPNTNYVWTGPNGFSAFGASVSVPIKGPEAAGEYSLIASQGSCVADPVIINIPLFYKQPIAAFSTQPDIPVQLPNPIAIRFFNQSEDADTFVWDFGDGQTSTERNPTHEYNTEGEFDVTLKAIKSDVCQTAISKGKYIIYEKNSIFIPNTFTPNGDNINDEFVVAINNLISYRIKIFNRWGDLLFESKSISDNWNGMHKGESLPIGTYYYVIEIVNLNRQSIRKSGSISIIR